MTMKTPWQVDWNLKLFRRPTGGHFAESGPDRDGQPQDRLNELCPVVPCLFGQYDQPTNSELLGSIKYMFTVHRAPSKRRRAARDVASVAWLQKGILDGYEVLKIWLLLVPTQGLSWGLMSTVGSLELSPPQEWVPPWAAHAARHLSRADPRC